MKKLQISDLVAGTMTWGQWGKKLRINDIASLQNFYVENGITTFDHADIYGGYTTEADFGKGFSASGLKRENIQLITKCGIQMAAKNRPHVVKHYDYSAEHITKSVENSLEYLKTDYLNLLLLHRPSPLMNPEIVAETVSKLKASGKVLHFGVSNFNASQTALLNTYIPVETNQVEFSITTHDAMINGSLDFMMMHKIKPMAWSPLGNYFKKGYPAFKELMQKLCKKYEADEDTLLIAWVLKHPAQIIPVIGTTREERILKSIEAKKIPLSAEDWFLMLQTVTGTEVP